MKNWAEKEIELAIKRERGDAPEDEWDYGVACYESAFKAFKSLLEDGHSGMSIGFTKHILNDLIDGRPLTPITDEDFKELKPDELGTIQCPRMSSLFKHYNNDGNITYTDVNRVIVKSLYDNDAWSSNLFTKWVDKNYSIELPYCGERFTFYADDFLINPSNGSWDSFYISHYILPNGERIDVDKIFTECNNDGWHEIDIDKMSEIPDFIKDIMEKNKVKKQNKWISVKDRLPRKDEEDRDILVFAKGKNGGLKNTTKYVITQYSTFPLECGTMGWQNTIGLSLSDFEITHWMLIPELSERSFDDSI